MQKPSSETGIALLLAEVPHVQLGILFGSTAEGRLRRDSDLDLAVMGDKPLEAPEKMALIEELAQMTGRPVDLVDLQSARGVIVGQVLRNGRRIYEENDRIYAELLKRHLFYQEDFAPYRRRILKERRKAWTEK